MVTYEFLLQNQFIRPLETVEKEKYALFHQQNYTIDLASTLQFLELQNAKYTVIAGYYAVLNATLWYFAKYYNLKISEADTGVHTNCLIVLEKFVTQAPLKQKIITLLTKARTEFVSFTSFKQNPEQTLPILLKQSSDKRKRYTYYSSERSLPQQTDQLKEAQLFIETVVKPYIYILEHLPC